VKWRSFRPGSFAPGIEPGVFRTGVGQRAKLAVELEGRGGITGIGDAGVLFLSWISRHFARALCVLFKHFSLDKITLIRTILA
jgi:hypothetical protein